ADTGATSHMTPHCHYIHNYTPKHISIQLAVSTIVYSAEMGSVVFNPVSVGKIKSLGVVELIQSLLDSNLQIHPILYHTAQNTTNTPVTISCTNLRHKHY
ncbi:hypothetical protein F4604DRAFT_1570468, partial [Suillus subluteus]